jgi:restriction system protein
MLPVLRRLAVGGQQSSGDVRDAVAAELQLSAEDLAAMLPSGRQTTFKNRIAWALSYLKQAGLAESPGRGIYRITTRGREVLAAPPDRIDISYLMQFPEFVAFRTAEPGDELPAPIPAKEGGETSPLTPDEQIRLGHNRLRANLAAEVLERVRQASPKFFEELVVELLVAMGYGGSREDASSVVGGGGDEGIDGIIKEDRLGLDTIYIQAKRWKDSVGRPEIQRFAGALQGQRARKGVFITTSTFTAEARSYAAGLQTTIVLIDGPQLAQLMLENGIGVTQTGVVKLLRLDEDYFVEE